MTAPIRVQLRRTNGWRMPPNTVKVDRTTRWGNPFNATQSAVGFPTPGTVYPVELMPLRTAPSLDRCLDLHLAWLNAVLSYWPDYLEPLRGKNLACWCPLDAPCHADVLLELANR